MNNIKEIKSLVKEAVEKKMYEAICTLDSSRNRNFTRVLDDLRCVCDITIVAVTDPAKPLSTEKERSELRIKFLLSKPSLREHLMRLSIEARKVPGVYSFSVKRVRKAARR